MEKPSGVYYGQWRKLRAGKCELAPAAAPVCRKRGLSALQGMGQQLPLPPQSLEEADKRCAGEGGLGKAGPRPPDTSVEPSLKLLILSTSHFTDETEVQRGIVTFPGSHSKS